TLTATNGGIVDLGEGVFRLFDSHIVRKAGLLPVQLAIASNALPFITTRASGTVAIADAPLTITDLSANAVEGQSNPITVATFQDTSAFPDINDFTAYVTYNPGGGRVLTAANGGIVVDRFGSTFSVLDDPEFFEEGSYPYSVTIVDSGG